MVAEQATAREGERLPWASASGLQTRPRVRPSQAKPGGLELPDGGGCLEGRQGVLVPPGPLLEQGLVLRGDWLGAILVWPRRLALASRSEVQERLPLGRSCPEEPLQHFGGSIVRTIQGTTF